MNIERLNLSSKEYKELFETLKAQGLSDFQIDNILNENFSTFEQGQELRKTFGNNTNFQDILQYLSDGYTIDELEDKGIKKQNIENFITILNDSNLTIENAKAINQYSNGSNMILSIKRNSASKEEIKQGIINDLTSKLHERGINENHINQIKNIIQELDYQKPLYENYNILKNIINEYNLPNNCYPTINTAVKNFNSFKHINKTIEQLDDGLSKVRIPQSMKLYRAIKSKSKIEELSTTLSENKSYTSTSPVYESSFAKYDDYDTVMELYAPKGTRGLYITPFSDYDDTEQEVLLDSNDIIFINIQTGVIDKNGKSKNILKGIILSKDKECYKDFNLQSTEKDTMQQINHDNLLVKQNNFSKLLSKIKAIFQRKKTIISRKKVEYEPQEIKSKTDTSYINSLKQQTYTKDEVIKNDIKITDTSTIEEPVKHNNELDLL